jgi:hypothetical protein
MSDEQTAAGGEDTTPAATVITLNADAPESFDSAESAVASLTAAREKTQPSAERAEADKPATAENELSDEDNAAPQDEATGEDEEDDPAKTPPLDLPRSWTKDRAEHWAKLDPDTQEFLLEQDRKASETIRRSQNEIADERKAAKVEREAAEKARQQYETQLPALMQSLQDAQQSAFADIRTVDDVTKLANEDPFRYLQWQAHQTKLQAVNAELERARGQQTQKQQTEWAEHVQKENELAAELIPELADKVKGPALTQRAADRLTELGFKSEELNALASGKEKLSIYDHRIQQLIHSDLKLQDIQKAPKAVAAKPLPPVQRPGVARAPGADKAANIQALTDKLSSSGSEKDALELLMARRATRRAS